MGVDNTSSIKSNNHLFDEEDLSDYYGLETNLSENNDIIDKYSKANLPTETSNENKEEYNVTSEKSTLIPTTFEWDQGGNSVYVTGSFCNWKQFFLMQKVIPGSFILTLNLPKGNHEYKFKVDNEWKFNEKYPTCNNSGNINNCLDTSNWEITVINTDEGTTAQSSNNTDDFSNYEKSKNFSIIKPKKYSNYKPNKNEFNEKIPELPSHYNNYENINFLSNQKYIGNEKYLKNGENNILSDNISYKKIRNFHHEQINHLIINDDKRYINKNIVCTISSRYRLKFTTFLYYKPHSDK